MGLVLMQQRMETIHKARAEIVSAIQHRDKTRGMGTEERKLSTSFPYGCSTGCGAAKVTPRALDFILLVRRNK